MKLKEKQGVILIYLKKSFKKKRRKPQAKQLNEKTWVKPWLKSRADSRPYDNLFAEL